jgi:cation diffusion facilitator CzcD-associated flavoprotein CzcO
MPSIEQVDVVIVGSGIMGLTVAKRLIDAGITDFLVLDKHNDVGGVWNCKESWSNASSRVQIIEPTYRLDDSNSMTDFTPQPELMLEMKRLFNQLGAAKLRLGTEVVLIEDMEAYGSFASFSRVVCKGGVIIKARKAVLLCTGGLQVPGYVCAALFLIVYAIVGSKAYLIPLRREVQR